MSNFGLFSIFISQKNKVMKIIINLVNNRIQINSIAIIKYSLLFAYNIKRFTT